MREQECWTEPRVGRRWSATGVQGPGGASRAPHAGPHCLPSSPLAGWPTADDVAPAQAAPAGRNSANHVTGRARPARIGARTPVAWEAEREKESIDQRTYRDQPTGRDLPIGPAAHCRSGSTPFLRARNAKLLETLKEARQQSSRCEEVDRPRSAAQWIRRAAVGLSRRLDGRRVHLRAQDAPDRLAQHRRDRNARRPDASPQRGADRRRGLRLRRVRRDRHPAGGTADGERRWSSAMPTRSASSSSPNRCVPPKTAKSTVGSCAPAIRRLSTTRPGRLRAHPEGRGRGPVLKRCPDVDYSDIGGLGRQIEADP